MKKINKSDIAVWVGIDPGIRADNCGISTKSVGSKIVETIASGSVENICARIFSLHNQGFKIGVVLEDPNLDSPVFGSWAEMQRVINSRNVSAMKAKFSALMKKGQAVGMNKAAAKIIHRFCNTHKIPIARVAPSTRSRIDNPKKMLKHPQMFKMPTKITKAQCEILTGYVGNSNEHGRDAATLISYMTFPKFFVIYEQQRMKELNKKK